MEPEDLAPDKYDPDLLVGELTGYRAFTLKGTLLYGLSEQDAPLQVGGSQAVCTGYHSHKKVLVNGPDGVPVMQEVPWHGPIPDPACGCGFWAYKTQAEALLRLHRHFVNHGGSRHSIGYGGRAGGFGDFGSADTIETGLVFAEVKLWGRTVEGEHGYRAEYCKLVALFDAPSTPGMDTLSKVAEYYGVPIVQGEGTIDPSKVEGVIKSISKPSKSRNGRYRPVDIIIDTPQGEDYLKVWPSPLSGKQPWSKGYTAIKDAAPGTRVSFSLDDRARLRYGEKFIKDARVLETPVVEDDGPPM